MTIFPSVLAALQDVQDRYDAKYAIDGTAALLADAKQKLEAAQHAFELAKIQDDAATSAIVRAQQNLESITQSTYLNAPTNTPTQDSGSSTQPTTVPVDSANPATPLIPNSSSEPIPTGEPLVTALIGGSLVTAI